VHAVRRLGPDLIALGALLAATAVVVATEVNLGAAPFEDAAMLMRYAANLAAGHGIVWNVGDHPLDGATDFLLVLVVAGVSKLGASVETAVRTVSLVAHFLTVALVYLVARRLHGLGTAASVVAAGYVAFDLALNTTEAGFGTAVFGFFVATSWTAAFLCRREPESWLHAALFASSCLLMALTRPEGALLAVFMLAAILVFTGVHGGTRILVTFAGIFGVLGLAYFAWRWTYFGSPLPNPYYIKAGGALHPKGLYTSAHATAGMLLPFLPLYALALWRPAGRREAAFSLIPIVLFTLIWVLVSDVTNYAGRFQYAVLVIAALSWPALFPGGRETQPVRIFVGAWLVLAVVGLSAYRVATLGDVPARDGRADVGRLLAPLAAKGYTLATTEAGGLPLYSGWRAVDTWGLNDRWIAHHGPVTAAYLDRYRPELIAIHGFFSPAARAPRCRCHAWNRMTVTVRSYAEARGYRLVAAFGTLHDTEQYWVRCDFPDARRIAAEIRSVPYERGGHVARDLAPRNECPPSANR